MEKTPSSKSNEFRAQFLEWARAAQDRSLPRTQHPVDELLAEHHLLRVVLAALQVEAKDLAHQQVFRPFFWNGAVDFVGNFGLLHHYRKKANHLFPEISRFGMADAIADLDREQQKDIEITLDLCDAVQEGDWEKVLRLVVVYVGSKRQQMDREEVKVLLPSKALIDSEHLGSLRVAFDELERRAMPDKGRNEYLEIARQLARQTGLPDPLVSS